MFWVPLFALLTGAAPAQQPFVFPSGTGSISGRVMAAETGNPIANAVVQITIYENLSGRFTSATTDAHGHFELSNLPAGHYQLAGSASRYLRTSFGQQQPGDVLHPVRTIELHDGEHFASADFALVHVTAIEGTIVDEFGDPVPNASIQVSQAQYAIGRRRLTPVGQSRPTDDHGRFRVESLVPGDYYVEALSGAFADPNAAGGFAVTFFPGTTDPSAAKPVTVAAGQDVLNASFALTPATTAAVTGTLLDADGKTFPNGTLMLLPSERAGAALFVMARAVTGPDGSFIFRNVPPGEYTIQAFGRLVSTAGNLGGAAFGYRTFSVDAQHLDPIVVTVPRPRTLRGHITFEGAGPLPQPDAVFIFPGPVDVESSPLGGGPPPMTVHDDWTFEVLAMSGRRIVTASVYGPAGPTGWTVSRVVLNGEDVTDTPIDLRERDVDNLEIVFTKDVTTVSGTVTDADGKPASSASVVIFADDAKKWGPWSRWVLYTASTPQGTFVVKGLPAGSYRAIVMRTLPAGEWQDPDFLKAQSASGGFIFSLGENESKSLALKIKS